MAKHNNIRDVSVTLCPPCVAGGSRCAREAREGISGFADSSPFFSRPARLFALAFATEVRAGINSCQVRRLILPAHGASHIISSVRDNKNKSKCEQHQQLLTSNFIHLPRHKIDKITWHTYTLKFNLI